MNGRRPTRLKRAATLRGFWQWSLLPVSIGLMAFGFAGWGIGLFLLVTAILGYGILSGRSRMFGPVVQTLKEADGRDEGVWLTIDDGPDADTTPRLLDVLDREGAVATFFLIGSRAQANVELVREIQRRGHGIGNHTQTHPATRFWILGGRSMWREMVSCQITLDKIARIKPRWFRAPVGHYNLQTHPVAKTLRMRIASWSCRGYDTIRRDVKKILASIQSDLKPGAVILIHDVTPVCVEVLEGTLEMLKERGLKTRLPELASEPQ
jgi:peptidoglycan/xylan/chitin deacetylase (PgdA/CDA1 family)